MSADLATALQEISSADEAIRSNDGLFRNVSQTLIAAIVVAAWAVSVAAILAWTWSNGKPATEFVCNTPPSTAGGVGSDCTNGWVATINQFKDIFTYGILPFVTLVIGFYFGQKTGSDSGE